MHLLATCSQLSTYLLQSFCNMYVYMQAYLCVCPFLKIGLYLWETSMQIASTEWFLGVQIQNFENLYNAEFAFGPGYCCCDSVEGCTPNIADLQGICMTHSCQPYFHIQIKGSSCNGMCSFDKTYQLTFEPSTSILDHAVLSIPFKEMEWSDDVRIKISYIVKLRATFRQINHA